MTRVGPLWQLAHPILGATDRVIDLQESSVVVDRVIDLRESSAVLLASRCGRSSRHTNELGPVHLPPSRDVGITDQRRFSAGR